MQPWKLDIGQQLYSIVALSGYAAWLCLYCELLVVRELCLAVQKFCLAAVAYQVSKNSSLHTALDVICCLVRKSAAQRSKKWSIKQYCEKKNVLLKYLAIWIVVVHVAHKQHVTL